VEYKFIFRLILFICLLLAIIYISFSLNPYWPYWFEQRQLAKELGVKIDDYPSPYAFPDGYFYSVLKPGMTIGQVHNIVKGYRASYNCGLDEVYYYFSDNDNRAIRFEVDYDYAPVGDDYIFINLMTEDDNSRSIHIVGCVPGLLKP